jgi:hypothetical protein
VKRFTFHRDWCGRETEIGVCEKCQKEVLLFKMKAHEKAHAKVEKSDSEGAATKITDDMEFVFTSDEETIDETAETPDAVKPRRQAARM